MISITMENSTSTEIQNLLQEANECATKINGIVDCVFSNSQHEVYEKILELGKALKTYLAHAQSVESEITVNNPTFTPIEIIHESSLS